MKISKLWLLSRPIITTKLHIFLHLKLSWYGVHPIGQSATHKSLPDYVSIRSHHPRLISGGRCQISLRRHYLISIPNRYNIESCRSAAIPSNCFRSRACIHVSVCRNSQFHSFDAGEKVIATTSNLPSRFCSSCPTRGYYNFRSVSRKLKTFM